MADTFQTQWQFDEVRLAGEGLMAYGIATLEGDEDGFEVTEIVLTGGHKLVASGAGHMGVPSPSNKLLFRMIASVVEADPDVEAIFFERMQGHTGVAIRPDHSQHSTYNAMGGAVA